MVILEDDKERQCKLADMYRVINSKNKIWKKSGWMIYDAQNKKNQYLATLWFLLLFDSFGIIDFRAYIFSIEIRNNKDKNWFTAKAMHEPN